MMRETWVVPLAVVGAAATAWFLNDPGLWPDKQQTKDFFSTILPAYMQGVGTVVAAYFAYTAFSTWTHQDRARKRAAIAEEIMQLAHRAADEIRKARRADTYVENLSIDLWTELEPRFVAVVEATRGLDTEVVSKLFAELDAKYRMARWIGLNGVMPTLRLSMLRGQMGVASRSISWLLCWTDQDRHTQRDLWHTEARKALSILGWDRRTLETQNALARRNDAIDDTIEKCIEQLSQKLLPHMNLTV